MEIISKFKSKVSIFTNKQKVEGRKKKIREKEAFFFEREREREREALIYQKTANPLVNYLIDRRWPSLTIELRRTAAAVVAKFGDYLSYPFGAQIIVPRIQLPRLLHTKLKDQTLTTTSTSTITIARAPAARSHR